MFFDQGNKIWKEEIKVENIDETPQWIKRFSKLLEMNEIQVENVMELADRDESGTISLIELWKFVKEHITVEPPTFNEIQQILHAFDLNGDNQISWEEF